MLELLLNKVLLLGLFMSILNVIRHVYKLIQGYFENEEGGNTKYIISANSLIMLGLSVSFILMTIFSGVTLS
jgi:hypothetical protein